MKRIRSRVVVLAAVMLASLVWQGCGLNLKALRKAAERGDAKAQHDLGAAYYYGDGTPLDVTEGLRCCARRRSRAMLTHNAGWVGLISKAGWSRRIWWKRILGSIMHRRRGTRGVPS